MRRRFPGIAVAMVLAATLVVVGEPAAADHPTEYCDPYDGRSTLIEVTTPDKLTGFYIHDRSSVPGTGLIGVVDEHPGGTWLLWETGKTPGLQTGGCKLSPYPCEGYGDDPCPSRWDSDLVIF